MKTLLSIVLLLPILFAFSSNEEQSTMIADESTLATTLKNLRDAKNDVQRDLHNTLFTEELKLVLKKPEAMKYPFAALSSMSTITSPDGKFRLFNWNVEDENQAHTHYCFVVTPGSRSGKPNRVVELKEDNFTISRHPEQKLTSEHWYGALYYKIIPIRKGSKTLYTIMGYSGNDRSTNEKILDVFYFKGKTLRIGYPLFQEEKESSVLLNRVFFEYSNNAFMSLNMNENLGQIVFDHLSPESQSMKGFRDYYVPDMSYDGYKWNGSNWEYVEDVIAYNNQNKRVKAYKPGSLSINDTTAAAEYIDVKDKWINPVDNNNPIDQGGNAIAPIEKYNPDKKTEKSKQSKQKNTKTKRRRNRLFKKKKRKPHSAIKKD